MLNRAIIIGNLGRDPELRSTGSGTAVCNMSVATAERVKRNDTWEDHTEWHRVVVFGRRAEVCAEHLRKGSGVAVEGKIRTRRWQDKDEKDRFSTEILADSVTFLPRSGGSDERRNSAGRGARPDDDVPF